MPLTRFLLAVLLAVPLGAVAADDDDDAQDLEPDLKKGEVMFRQCALCHGHHGQGILGGKYPRIAGFPEYYLLNALHDYKSGKRGYDAMVVVGSLSTADDQDLVNLAAYISDLDITLDVPGPDDASARKGRKLYKNDCKTCHGRAGEGKSRKESPPLRGQYHEYLMRQIELFKNKQRVHAGDPEDETFVDEDGEEVYEDEDLLDIFAFIASLDDKEQTDAEAETEDE